MKKEAVESHSAAFGRGGNSGLANELIHNILQKHPVLFPRRNGEILKKKRKETKREKEDTAAETVAFLFFLQCNLGRSALKAWRKSRSLHNSGKGCFPAFSCNGACARSPTRRRERHTLFLFSCGFYFFWCVEGDGAKRWQLWVAAAGCSRCDASTGQLPASLKLQTHTHTHRETLS